MTKRTKWHVVPPKTILCWPHEENLNPWLHVPIERTSKTLIRIGRCPGWSDCLSGRTGNFVGFVVLWLTGSFVFDKNPVSAQRTLQQQATRTDIKRHYLHKPGCLGQSGVSLWITGSLVRISVWPHTFLEIYHEIISTVIFPFLLLQEGQMSVSGESTCTKYWLTA